MAEKKACHTKYASLVTILASISHTFLIYLWPKMIFFKTRRLTGGGGGGGGGVGGSGKGWLTRFLSCYKWYLYLCLWHHVCQSIL